MLLPYLPYIFLTELLEALKIVGNQSKEKLSDLKEIVRKLAYAGVSKSEITDMIEEVYKKI